jgi:hypothetical protein
MLFKRSLNRLSNTTCLPDGVSLVSRWCGLSCIVKAASGLTTAGTLLHWVCSCLRRWSRLGLTSMDFAEKARLGQHAIEVPRHL